MIQKRLLPPLISSRALAVKPWVAMEPEKVGERAIKGTCVTVSVKAVHIHLRVTKLSVTKNVSTVNLEAAIKRWPGW